MNERLRVVGIQRKFNHAPDIIHVLKGIDFAVREAEAVAIVGPSGSGKTTLLHLLGGLDEPTEGEVYIDEANLYSLSDKERSRLRNKKIGFVFQFYHLLSEFSVLENVVMPGLISQAKGGLSPSQLYQKAVQVLERVGLKERMRFRPGRLSGGEQQRAAIARAVINDPAFLFCDEPTGNLDAQNSQKVTELLLNLCREGKRVLVMVTHNQQLAQLADKVFTLKDGRLYA